MTVYKQNRTWADTLILGLETVNAMFVYIFAPVHNAHMSNFLHVNSN